ncbi:hypothetical protein L873DRAFT_1400990 [Choiromyces venosus 120613-1]|uniref:Uncharacterized protein n=1 Tax=Choiromyces venosus 120613-1 TaxID=1336337 RepID=A0A3N4J8X6_9PEZI|nr:hypothetical protein L873DRAFT_1400990 [Choiromyces venosus 120613-1]
MTTLEDGQLINAKQAHLDGCHRSWPNQCLSARTIKSSDKQLWLIGTDTSRCNESSARILEYSNRRALYQAYDSLNQLLKVFNTSGVTFFSPLNRLYPFRHTMFDFDSDGVLPLGFNNLAMFRLWRACGKRCEALAARLPSCDQDNKVYPEGTYRDWGIYAFTACELLRISLLLTEITLEFVC